MRKPEPPEEDERNEPGATGPDNASQSAQPAPEQNQKHVQKREVTMSDGRYLIYFTFPAIDKEFEAIRPGNASNNKR